MPGTSKSPTLSQVALCVLWSTPSVLSQEVYNSALAFILYVCMASRSGRGESLDVLDFFLSMCIVLHICMAFQVPQNMSELFKARINILIPKLFLKFFVQSIVASIVSVTSGSHKVRTCSCDDFLKHASKLLPSPPGGCLLALGKSQGTTTQVKWPVFGNESLKEHQLSFGGSDCCQAALAMRGPEVKTP